MVRVWSSSIRTHLFPFIILLGFTSLHYIANATIVNQLRQPDGVYVPHKDHPKHSGTGHHSHNSHKHSHEDMRISSSSILGSGTGPNGCKHTTDYFVNPKVQFKMCVGQQDQDLKNGMAIINLIRSRGFLPTCRILHHMLWMQAESSPKKEMNKGYFIDIGSNIGSCAVHMAALGYPVVAVDPLPAHVDTIKGSININPGFAINLYHAGIKAAEKVTKMRFVSGARNYGATAIEPIEEGDSTTVGNNLTLLTTDRVVGNKNVALMKIDCEGCEYEALLGAKRSLKNVPMIKLELVQESYVGTNTTDRAGPNQVLKLLNTSGFTLYLDHWAEMKYYFGLHHKDIYDFDRVHGSAVHKLEADENLAHAFAKKILSEEIHYETFDRRKFLKSYTDIIAIEASLARRMKAYWNIS